MTPVSGMDVFRRAQEARDAAVRRHQERVQASERTLAEDLAATLEDVLSAAAALQSELTRAAEPSAPARRAPRQARSATSVLVVELDALRAEVRQAEERIGPALRREARSEAGLAVHHRVARLSEAQLRRYLGELVSRAGRA